MLTTSHAVARLALVVATAVATMIGAGSAGAGAVSANASEDTGVVASFDGGLIRLSDGWDEARACTSDADGTRCYRSEAEMDREEASQPMQVQCTASVRLYSGLSYGGTVLELTVRGTLHNLASYGFSNVTSSYGIGGCAARFYDTASGGTLYPGNTNAGVWSSSMLSGWDNRVSSVYIF